MDPTRKTLSPVQYSLRALLAAVTVVCLLSALFAPFIRAMSPAHQLKLAWIIACTCMGAAFTGVFMCRQRWRIEHQSGPRILNVPSRTGRRWILGQAAYTVSNVAFVFIFLRDSLFGIRLGDNILLSLVPYVVVIPASMRFTTLLLPLYWGLKPGGFEIYENGIVLDALGLVPWKKIRGYSWRTGGKSELVLRLGFFVRNIKVPPKLRPEVEQAFDKFLPDFDKKN